jgi:malate dehydrogenase (oxaloacetate-decarboxylating)
VLYPGRQGLDRFGQTLAAETNPRSLSGSADEALDSADVYIGLSAPGAVSIDGIRSMADDAIVFAMANPTPEIAPEELEGLVAVMGTGRSDYPNQINNVLAFPGLFRGALDVRATSVTEGMKVAAALALAAVVPRDHLGADYILPSVLDRGVAPAIAAAVSRAAIAEGVARGSVAEPALA